MSETKKMRREHLTGRRSTQTTVVTSPSQHCRRRRESKRPITLKGLGIIHLRLCIITQCSARHQKGGRTPERERCPITKGCASYVRRRYWSRQNRDRRVRHKKIHQPITYYYYNRIGGVFWIWAEGTGAMQHPRDSIHSWIELAPRTSHAVNVHGGT